MGVLGGISAVLDGGTTYLERKDQYGEVSAMVDSVAHTTLSVGAIYVRALIGTAIPIPVVGTVAGAFFGGIINKAVNTLYDNAVGRT